MKTMWIANHLLPIHAVQLGNFVLDIANPDQDFHLPSIDGYEKDISSIRSDSFENSTSETKSSSFEVLISKLLGSAYDTSENEAQGIIADATTTHTLRNSGDWFRATCKSNAARDWLSEAVRSGQDAYLVVGMKTLTNAQITVKKTKTKKANTWFHIPLAQFIDWTNMLGTLVCNCKWKGDTKNLTSSISIPGEQIYAVQYRRVRFSRFSNQNVEKARLESGTRWEVYVGGRGNEGESSTQIIEPSMDDDVGTNDLQGAYERFVSGEDEFIYLH